MDYLGIGKVIPFLAATNDILTARGVNLPLPSQGTTTMENRLEKGARAQAEIFGDHMKECVRITLNDTDITQKNAEPFMTSWAEDY